MMQHLRLTKLSIKDGGRLEFSHFSTRLESTSLVLADIADTKEESVGVPMKPVNLALAQLGVVAFSSSNSEACLTPSSADNKYNVINYYYYKIGIN